MYICAKNSSPFPVLPDDGAIMSLNSDGTDPMAQCHIQLSGPTDREVATARSGKLRIGHVRVVSDGATCAVFVFKLGKRIAKAPFSLGLEWPDVQNLLLQALRGTDELTHEKSWSMGIELVERDTQTTKTLRLVGLAPAFCQSVAKTLKDSRHTTRARHDELLLRLYARYPDPAQLFHMATHVGTFSR